MCALMLAELHDDERSNIEKAMAMLNPYLQIAAVDWMAEHKETNA